jgi:two-component system repressor protein LuxO
MGKTRPRVLLVEDTPPLARLYQEYLRFEEIELEAVECGQDALDAINRDEPDAILLDLRLPDMDGLEILRWIRERNLPSEVVIITAHGSVSTAVEAMRNGAYDFLVKPFSSDRLTVTLKNALERRALKQIVVDMTPKRHGAFAGFVGSSLVMQDVYRLIERAAPSAASVFITGESGTGKELCAEAIHSLSPRVQARLVAINCAAIPHDLLESEIFGHVKGAFTGAVSNRTGAATLADGGTLFLDEICDMAPDLQAKLLRFVQSGVFQPVGSSEPQKVNVRFVCATNRDPLAEIAAGRFRADLYYRLHVIPIHMPPLRERDDDVAEIAQQFLISAADDEDKAFNGFDADTREIFRSYDWPGNVRELQNVVRNIVVLNDAELATADMLPTGLESVRLPVAANDVRSVTMSQSVPLVRLQPLHELEREAIEAALVACDDNVPRAAAMLEVSPSTIYRKMQAWGRGDLAS